MMMACRLLSNGLTVLAKVAVASVSFSFCLYPYL
jgi:hypothetical protein